MFSTAISWVLLRSRPCWVSLSTCLQQPLSALWWRGMLLAVGVAYACSSVSAASMFTRGLLARDLDTRRRMFVTAVVTFPLEPRYLRAVNTLPRVWIR